MLKDKRGEVIIAISHSYSVSAASWNTYASSIIGLPSGNIGTCLCLAFHVSTRMENEQWCALASVGQGGRRADFTSCCHCDLVDASDTDKQYELE